MSHFFTLVLVEDDGGDIESQVMDLLAPYDENIEVAPYERECSCVGQQAREAACAQAESELGTIEDLRASFKEKYPRHAEAQYIDEAADAAWEAHIKPLQDRRGELLKTHPDKDKPDPTCGFYTGPRSDRWPEHVEEGDRYADGSGCGGTGKYISTYNPKSKWDYWSIGGRWTGELDSEYSPYKDPQNIVPCDLCNGTGDRPGWVTYEVRQGNSVTIFAKKDGAEDYMEVRASKYVEEIGEPELIRCFKDTWAEKCNGCNGCHGKGKRVKWSLEPFEGDVLPVKELPEDTIPFALVTPDSAWYERGHMGWWAYVSGEKEEDTWKDEVKSLLSMHQDCLAVVCDLHI